MYLKKLNRKQVTMLGFLLFITLLWVSSSHAGTGGEEFKELYDQLMGWVQGTLGKVVAVSMILVGIIAGVARQSIMAFAIGIAAGLGLYYAPTVIDKTLSATININEVDLNALSQSLSLLTHL